MKKTFFIFILILVFISQVMFSKPLEQTIKNEFDAKGIKSFLLKNINGKVNLFTSNTDTIKIKAIKTANTKEKLNNLKILFKQKDNTLSCKVEHNGWFSNPGRVDFEIELPKNLLKLRLSSVNGKINLKGEYGDLNVHTVNGKINFDGISKQANFKTVNGGIYYCNEDILKGDLSFKTVNGRIVVELNKNSSFEIKCSTVNGDIDSEFDFKIIEGFIGAKMTGKLNEGKYSVNAATVNGSIKINKF